MNTQPAREASSPSVSHPTSAPQVRTLLLTDLCESTTLVERLGDSLAAALFREHDRLVLELQQRWRGRLIDRSDGLLLLFERPIDGLGFALDYMRGLHELGQSRKLKLQARAGLHVGEVLTWENTDEAVRAGAKSLEVEGLAKPLAARLMSLARPGQILLSAVAEPMSHRAASELGERGQHLVWKSYGRWRFKGVPDAQEIHEVGEPGLAALRMPRHTPKAWRDIPLWRRPAALAAEVLLIAGLGTGAWFLTRSPPAIAFSERDWVVVGDLRNLTGQPVLDESLEQAFRISLEQSRYVNVLSDLKVRDTLALMKRQPDDPLDRTTASEVALRDGARAVILPTVAEVGGRVRVSAEVIDPHTQTTVYAESADGPGAGSVLNSIDKVTEELRSKLGEALKAIEHDSAPLPHVSTANLDALKAYALGMRKRNAGEPKEAQGYFMRAIEIDPNFALANLAMAQVYGNLRDLPAKRRELEIAQRLRSHLSSREALMLDAEIARSGPIAPQLQRWKQVIEMYPDSHSAQMVLAQDGMFYANRYAESLPHAKAAAVAQFPGHAMAQYLVGMIQLGMEQYQEAEKSFQLSRDSGFKGAGFSFAYVYGAQRNYAKVEEVLAKRRNTGVATAELEVPYNDMLFALDRGQWDSAMAAAQQGLDTAIKVEPLISGAEWRNRKLTASMLAEKETGSALEADLMREIARIKDDSAKTDAIYDSHSEIFLLSVGYLGACVDNSRVIEKVLTEIEDSPDIDRYPLLVQMQQVLLAEQERLSGAPQRAIERLSPIAKNDDAIIPVHRALARAARAAGDNKLALSEAQWLMVRRGRAFVEVGAGDLQTPINVVDSTLVYLDAAELFQQLGSKDRSRESLSRFLSIWPQQKLTKTIQKRVSVLSD